MHARVVRLCVDRARRTHVRTTALLIIFRRKRSFDDVRGRSELSHEDTVHGVSECRRYARGQHGRERGWTHLAAEVLDESRIVALSVETVFNYALTIDGFQWQPAHSPPRTTCIRTVIFTMEHLAKRSKRRITIRKRTNAGSAAPL